MKKLILLAALALVSWNAYNKPAGSEYFHPVGGEVRRYGYQSNSGLMRHAVDGTLSWSNGDNATMRHLETVDLDGIKYAKIRSDCNPKTRGTSELIIYSRLAKDGIYTRRSMKSRAPEYLELPLPPQVGRRWQYRIDNEIMECEIAAIGSMELGGKTYDKCVMVKSWGTVDSLPASGTTWYAPGVGVLKRSSSVAGSSFDIVLHDHDE